MPGTPGDPTPQGTGTTYSDADPNYDKCSATEDGKAGPATIQMGGRNIGDLLNRSGVSWGWFQGVFEYPGYLPGHYDSSQAGQDCTGKHNNMLGQPQTDYNPHHEPFEYYQSTANPQHLPPTSISMIGRQDQANHQYDLADFWAAADDGNLPAVSYLKAADYQDGHAGYSDPIDEQNFLVGTINHLEKLPSWKNTAVAIAYDESDGWYDHQMGPILTPGELADPHAVVLAVRERQAVPGPEYRRAGRRPGLGGPVAASLADAHDADAVGDCPGGVRVFYSGSVRSSQVRAWGRSAGSIVWTAFDSL